MGILIPSLSVFRCVTFNPFALYFVLIFIHFLKNYFLYTLFKSFVAWNWVNDWFICFNIHLINRVGDGWFPISRGRGLEEEKLKILGNSFSCEILQVWKWVNCRSYFCVKQATQRQPQAKIGGIPYVVSDAIYRSQFTLNIFTWSMFHLSRMSVASELTSTPRSLEILYHPWFPRLPIPLFSVVLVQGLTSCLASVPSPHLPNTNVTLLHQLSAQAPQQVSCTCQLSFTLHIVSSIIFLENSSKSCPFISMVTRYFHNTLSFCSW